ncbi:hypothetical protein B0H19DRAFT_282018 [Mycena capillaripes]|nr:hypothetical protein B0H19DRAFT_282018 [Mycena capillaripes]
MYPKRPPSHGLLSPSLLTWVCRIWRTIALSTPTLWCAVDAFLPLSRPASIEGELHIMKNSLARSGFCPLSISLECRPYVRLDPFIHAIAAHCQRLEHLRMLAEFHHLFSFRSPLLWLRSLRLGLQWTRDPDEYLLPPTVFLAAPLLRKVALQKYEHGHRAILPWGQLTVLIVDSLAPYDCARVLSLAPSLVFSRLRTYATEYRPIPPPMAPLLHLDTLVLRISCLDDPIEGLMASFTCPALRRLQVPEVALWPNPLASLCEFIGRSECILQQMHIYDPEEQVDPCGPYRKAWPTVSVSCGPQPEHKNMFFPNLCERGSRDRNYNVNDYWEDEEVVL